MIQPNVRSRKKASGPERVAKMKEKINNPEYIDEAIFRLAQVLSNDILGIPQGGEHEERICGREGAKS